MNKHITELYAEGRSFQIIYNEDHHLYLSIENKYITDGKMNTTLNGLQMHASPSLEGCINNTKTAIRVEALEAKGLTTDEIIREMAR